ncbi:MAG: c-type cytochrome [Acidobacteriota bacterium]|nr:c-type cytochrome [Acidobacteriota bacterium]
MKRRKSAAAGAFAALIVGGALQLAAQVAPQPPQAGRGAGAARPAAYPDRPPADPAVVDRGKALYGVNCNFCHGSDARGGEGGPNLLRSELVLNDKNGELIAPVVQNGRGEMPRISLSTAQVGDVAAYIHSFKVGGYDISRMVPPSILVGDASAGEAYFKTTCASCHSATGDLKGIAGKFADPKQLQNHWLMPGGGRGGRGGGGTPTTVTVTMPSGQKIEGRLSRIDDFIVIVGDADGTQHTIRRDGDSPKVEIHDPMQPHKNLLPKYTDKDIHNLTAYLVNLK